MTPTNHGLWYSIGVSVSNLFGGGGGASQDPTPDLKVNSVKLQKDDDHDAECVIEDGTSCDAEDFFERPAEHTSDKKPNFNI